MKKKILVYGAGAIGRGYMPWVYSPEAYDYFFVEVNSSLREALKQRKAYTTFRTKNGQYESLRVPVAGVFAPGEEAQMATTADCVIVAVGPRNVLSVQGALRGTSMPVICHENDPSSAVILAAATRNPNVVFGIPDVITSSTAPQKLLESDPLAIVTEDGTCFADERVRALGGDCKYVDVEELRKQWLAKLYIHNTPHCITAYLGSKVGATYVHEAMANRRVVDIVDQAMREMEQMVVRTFALDQGFVHWYAEKELARFRNELLFDPILRVAREPFRKLGHRDRLIGAAQLCLSAGIVPRAVMIGIMSAFYYDNKTDPDANISYVVNALKPQDFLKIIIRLRDGEALFESLKHNWKANVELLNSLI